MSIKKLQYRDKGGKVKLTAQVCSWIEGAHPNLSLELQEEAVLYIVHRCQTNPDPINNHFGTFFDAWLNVKLLGHE